MYIITDIILAKSPGTAKDVTHKFISLQDSELHLNDMEEPKNMKQKKITCF